MQSLPKKSTSFFLVFSLIGILILGIIFKVDIRVLLILGLSLTVMVIYKMGNKITEIIDNMQVGIKRAFPALCIFILIGMLIGAFVQSGVIPSIVYYGLNLINVNWFLPIGLIVCSITSLATGTSWGTCGTVGVAFMAMGISLGIPAPIVAGMVVSGAFFGDKISPLSDTTNLAAVSAGTSLYKHIKSMLYTTAPAYILTLIIYTIIGINYSTNNNINNSLINDILTTLHSNFNINIFMLVPIFVVLFLSIKKINSIVALAIGTGVEFVDNLLNRGGIQSMMWTFSLSFIALCLGSLLEVYGFLQAILKGLISNVKRLGSLAVLVITSCIFTNLIMGEIYLSIILNGSMFKKIFEDKKIDNSMLSRYLEEGGTLTGGLIPWSTAGAFVSGALGVSAFAYAPFAFLNILNPIISIIFSYLGIGVIKTKK